MERPTNTDLAILRLYARGAEKMAQREGPATPEHIRHAAALHRIADWAEAVLAPREAA
jgi:hypothetical protein